MRRSIFVSNPVAVVSKQKAKVRVTLDPAQKPEAGIEGLLISGANLAPPGVVMILLPCMVDCTLVFVHLDGRRFEAEVVGAGPMAFARVLSTDQFTWCLQVALRIPRAA